MTIEEEVWRPVHGWPYEVSTMGCVRNARTGYVLSPFAKGAPAPNGTDYQMVTLWDRGRKTHKRVHILVAEAFIGSRPEGHDTDHINGLRDDNRLDNLRYLPRHWNAAERKLTVADVEEIRRLYKNTDMTQEELGEQYGTSHMAISEVVRGESWVGVPENEEAA